MKIDCDGLTVSAPMRETLSWIESVLQEKANVGFKINLMNGRIKNQLVWYGRKRQFFHYSESHGSLQ